MMKSKFMFSTGIENSYPTIFENGKKIRIDEMEKCGHYERWKEDFALVKEMGIEFLRYGPPYYKVHEGPGKYDWSFTDETFRELKRLDITPIVDLCHFGVPDWIGDFQNADWPHYFAEFAGAFARRFPDLQLYTPINEIFIAAVFSGQYGWWNESLTSDKAFVNALKILCKANALAMQEILKVQPDATFIQSESSEYFHPEDPSCRDLADFLNRKRFLSLDLCYSHPVSVTMYKWLLDNGMTDKEYMWFMNNKIKAKCIMGNDYYITNEHLVLPDGSTRASGEIFGYYVITKQYYDRYHLPVMHTETNIIEPNSEMWLHKEWANLYRFKQDGFPIVGFTWYSLTDQMDWDSALRHNAGNVNKLGLYDLDRKIRPVGKAYKHLIEVWKPVLADESFGIQTYLH
ncbi:family 1 glycosylhydrolase [Mucilaginibacter sp. Bleaf8]|uniref:family 1 glycosylhydrolase n=1 Tax=Mucilaginibacter sp. Bleaf8 TaxID=2834430 RepID=UPI001BD12B70|nr:family 1 glycosylhydrolase [Mucilaginibacter sp. Bleaf8]MBS7566936.1 family 1 glycosylhydrolase [Mucilaginibacter sp. Bleaf8]